MLSETTNPSETSGGGGWGASRHVGFESSVPRATSVTLSLGRLAFPPSPPFFAPGATNAETNLAMAGEGSSRLRRLLLRVCFASDRCVRAPGPPALLVPVAQVCYSARRPGGGALPPSALNVMVRS